MVRRSGMYRRLIHVAEYGALVSVGALLRLFPDGWVYGFARFLGVVAFDVFRIRRGITLDNLRVAFGSRYDESELKVIARNSYRHMAMTFIELALMPKIKNHIAEMVDVTGLVAFKNALGEKKGLILVSGHFGSWEMNGASVVMAGFPTTVVVKRQSNPLIDKIVDDYRRMLGLTTVTPGASVKTLIHALRSGGVVGLISDQNAGRGGVFVNFFGRLASTPQGAAQLALKYGSPVIAVMTRRIKPGRYYTIVRAVPVLPDDTVESLTGRYTAILEEIIRDYPDQYFWMHKRWKTRPSPEK